jgi:hypothetical protein
MILLLETLTPPVRKMTALALVVAAALVLLTPPAMFAWNWMDQATETAQLSAEIDRLDVRVRQQESEILARFEAASFAAEDRVAVADPDRARAMFEATTELMRTELLSAGVEMQDLPELQQRSVGETLQHLTYRLYFIGEIQPVLTVLAADEFSDLDVSLFDFITLSGAEHGRIRGEIEFSLLIAGGGDDD